VVDQFGPVVRRVDVDLDHPGVGRHLQQLQARVARRRVAFQHDLDPLLGRRGLDRGQQLEVVLQVGQRRHEDVHHTAAAAPRGFGARAVGALRVAHLHAQRGAGQPARRLLARGRADRVDGGCPCAGRGPLAGPGRFSAGGGPRPSPSRKARPCRATVPPSAKPPPQARAASPWPAGAAAAGHGAGNGARGAKGSASNTACRPPGRRRPSPGQRVQRQPVAHGRIAGHQVHAFVAQEPGPGDPGRAGGADGPVAAQAAADSRPRRPGPGRRRGAGACARARRPAWTSKGSTFTGSRRSRHR
jgi:hypothetical protein